MTWISDDITVNIEHKVVHDEYGYVEYSGTWSSWPHEDDPNPVIPMKWAENLEGKYIGTPEEAEFLCKERGIRPETFDDNKVCSIGFCEKEQKWYGWSHRAIYGFGIGDKVESEDHLCSSSGWIDEYLEEHPEMDKSLPVGFEAKTLDDAKKMAIAFADAVG